MSVGRDQVKEIMHDTIRYDVLKAAQNGPGSPDLITTPQPVYFETVSGMGLFPGSTLFSLLGATTLPTGFQIMYDVYYDMNVVILIKSRAIQPSGTFPYSPKTISPVGYNYMGTAIVDNTSGANFIPGVISLNAAGIAFQFIG